MSADKVWTLKESTLKDKQQQQESEVQREVNFRNFKNRGKARAYEEALNNLFQETLVCLRNKTLDGYEATKDHLTVVSAFAQSKLTVLQKFLCLAV